MSETTITPATKTARGYRTSFGLISNAQAALLQGANHGIVWSRSGSRRASMVKLHALGLVDWPDFGATLTPAGERAQVELFGELPAVGTLVARRGDGVIGVVKLAQFAAVEVEFQDGTTCFGWMTAFLPLRTADEVIAASTTPVTTRTAYVPWGRFTAVATIGTEVEFLFVGDAWNVNGAAPSLGYVHQVPAGDFQAVAPNGDVVGTFPFRAEALSTLANHRR
jgi:hypothetical protein